MPAAMWNWLCSMMKLRATYARCCVPGTRRSRFSNLLRGQSMSMRYIRGSCEGLVAAGRRSSWVVRSSGWREPRPAGE